MTTLEQEADARLEALLTEGLDSGKVAELNCEFWTDLKTEAELFTHRLNL